VTEAAWRQRLFDWEESDRDVETLRRHLVACRFSRSQVELLVSCSREGQAIKDNGLGRSLLTASKAQVARLTGLSPTAIHKAKEALVAAGLMRYTPGHYLVSWGRVWDLWPPPDPVQAMLSAPDAPDAPDEGRPVTAGHHRSPPVTSARQEPKKERFNYSKTQLQENQETKKGAQPLLQTGGRDVIDAMQIRLEESVADQVERFAGRILTRARVCERRCQIIDPECTLKPHTARALARRVAKLMGELGNDTQEEFSRILDSLDTREIQNTGGYLVASFKRRGWWTFEPAAAE